MVSETPRPPRRLGFFSRLLDDVDAGDRYRLALDQIVSAERLGFHSAWVAQHHFQAAEGGLPAPFVFLAFVAARTSGIRLGTGVVTLPLENALRVAEDTAVLDLLSGGRLEFGIGSGGTPSAFATFGQDSARRGELLGQNLRVILDAWRGRVLDGGNRLYPDAPALARRVWQATFSAEGGARAGAAGDGLLLSRTQPRPAGSQGLTLARIQMPILDAYLDALPEGTPPRILGSRSVFVADDRRTALACAEQGMARFAARLRTLGREVPDRLSEALAAFDVHVGTPEDVIASLGADRTLDRVTDIAFQVHPVDPPHELILRSLELVAGVVAPALGLRHDARTAGSDQGARGERIAALAG